MNQRIKLSLAAALVLSLFATKAQAQSYNAMPYVDQSVSGQISAFRYYYDVMLANILAPTIVETTLPAEYLERKDFVVLDVNTNTIEPNYFTETFQAAKPNITLSSNALNNNSGFMNDENVNTFSEFLLNQNSLGTAVINLTSDQQIAASGFNVMLGDNVALPVSVDVTAIVDGSQRVVLSNYRMDDRTIRFPQTTSSNWTITFSYVQPLRITELNLLQDNLQLITTRKIRFLAQPGQTYKIYSDPDRDPRTVLPESADLAMTNEVLSALIGQKTANPTYAIADIDKDNIPDVRDNCVTLANPDQQDVNKNGVGDLCEDFDFDGVANNIDNCSNVPNRNQRDTDGDKIGDACDGAESRLTEKHAWLPWLGMGFAAVVLVSLFVVMAKTNPNENKPN